MKIKHILVAYDFSETAKHALKMGCALAEVFSARLEVLYVASPVLPQLPTYNALMAGLAGNLENTVSAVMSRVTKPSKKESVRWDALIQEGNPYKVITKRAEQIGADLVIVGTHGFKGWKRVFLGSVAEKVVRHSHCSVLIHRHTETKGFKKILAPVDMSKVSMNNLKIATEWAKTFSAEVAVVHAIDPIDYMPIAEFNVGVDYGEIQDLQEFEEKRFQNFIKDAKRNLSGLSQVKWRADALNGLRVRSIVEFAKKTSRDLIIMAAHEGKIGRFFLGSTTESVSRYAPCSVLVLKEKGAGK